MNRTTSFRPPRCAPLWVCALVGVLLIGTCAPSLAADIACVGDCHGDGAVTVDEILVGVNIALGNESLDACPALDRNGSGDVEIDELVTAVSNALNQCPVLPTATAAPRSPTVATTIPTSSPTPTSTPHAATPSIRAHSIAGGISLLLSGLQAVPAVVGGIAGGFVFTTPAVTATGAAFDTTGSTITADCPNGGKAMRTGSIPGAVEIDLAKCAIPTSDGSLVLDGMLFFNLDFRFTATVSITGTFLDGTGIPGVVTHANITGSLMPDLGGRCTLTAATLVVSGTLNAQTPDGVVGVTLQVDNVNTAFQGATFSENCLPTIYSLTLDGSAMLSDTVQHDPFNVTLTGLRLSTDATANPTRIEVSGAMSGPCFGGSVTLTTPMELNALPTQMCPIAGVLAATTSEGDVQVFYRTDGSLDIDTNHDGIVDESEPSCLAPTLLACPM